MTEELEDYFSLSQKLNELVRKGYEQIKAIEGKGDEELDNKDVALMEYLDEMKAKIEKIEKKMLMALGQMYCGVIVPNTYSIRKDGKIYNYKCLSEANCKNFLMTLSKNKDILNVIKKVDDRNIFLNLLGKITDGDKYELEFNDDIAQGKTNLNEIDVYDLENDWNRNLKKGTARKVVTLQFNRGSIDFIDDEGENIRNSTIEKLLVKKFQKEIVAIRERVMQTLKTKRDFFDGLEREINEKLGRWLMVAQLQSDKIENIAGWTHS